MSRFDECLSFVLAREGGFSNNPSDHGGATQCGITQSAYTGWRRRCGLSDRPVRNSTMDEITAIYKSDYWQASKSNILPAPIDLCTFDAAVQHGPSRAVKMLQKALGVTEDGDFGLQSIDALSEEIHAGLIPELAKILIDNRVDYYHGIVSRDASQIVFLKGWEIRMDALREAIK